MCQFLTNGAYSSVEPPEIPSRPTLIELAKSLEGFSIRTDDASPAKKLRFYDGDLKVKNFLNGKKWFKAFKNK